MVRKLGWLSGLVWAAALWTPIVAQADTKTFRAREDGGSRATFVSDAPLETITGVTSLVTGKVTFDPDSISDVKGTFKVPVGTIRTGVDLRDEHLRGKNWLDAKNNPHAYFEIEKLVKGPKSLKPNKDTKVKVLGKFTVHGITQQVLADATVRWIPFSNEIKGTPGIDNDVLRVKASFAIKLEDHQVSVPAIVRLKVSNEIDVNVDLRAVAEGAVAKK